MKNKTIIIAEIGVNHNGSLELAYKLIDKAKESFADIVKFQVFKAESIVAKNAPKAKYQQKTTGKIESQYEMIKKLELTYNDFIKIKRYCDEKKIIFLSSCDLVSIDFIYKLGVNTFKIPSGEINNPLYLKKIGSFDKKIILSTGMSSLAEIENALDILIKSGTKKKYITVLQCNTEYPTPFEDVNLNAMITIRNAFKINIGYSDHTEGIEVPLAAVAMGATIIEKHFTLDKNIEGPDHKASLEPNEFKQMVLSIRNIEKSFGDGIKKPSSSEKKNISIVRKSIVASKIIKKGDIFTVNNITLKRPGTGISPMLWYDLLGKIAAKDFEIDEYIKI